MESSHLVALAVVAVLLVSVWTDLRTRTIPDTASVALVVLAGLASWFRWHDVTFAQLGIGLLVGFALGAVLFYAGAMGGGDAKLCAGLGAVCGWPRVFEVLFATALSGGFVSLWAKRRGESTIAYAPAFAVGYIVTLAITWTSDSSTGLWHLMTGRPLS